MRQIAALRLAIGRRRVEYRYPDMNLNAQLHGATIPSLEEILEPYSSDVKFDPETDKFLEKRAQELFEQRNRDVGK